MYVFFPQIKFFSAIEVDYIDEKTYFLNARNRFLKWVLASHFELFSASFCCPLVLDGSLGSYRWPVMRTALQGWRSMRRIVPNGSRDHQQNGLTSCIQEHADHPMRIEHEYIVYTKRRELLGSRIARENNVLDPAQKLVSCVQQKIVFVDVIDLKCSEKINLQRENIDLLQISRDLF